MHPEKEESRKEKLARLLAKNRTRLARDKLIDRYRQEPGFLITTDQFIDLAASHALKSAAYTKVSTLQNQKFLDWSHVVSSIDVLQAQCHDLDETFVILYYMDIVDTGGIRTQLRTCWELFQRIESEPRSDIVFVEEKLVFGLCVEIEEYDYLLTSWGF